MANSAQNMIFSHLRKQKFNPHYVRWRFDIMFYFSYENYAGPLPICLLYFYFCFLLNRIKMTEITHDYFTSPLSH